MISTTRMLVTQIRESSIRSRPFRSLIASHSGFFDSIWGHVRNFMGSSSISHQDARHWHKKIYSGMVSPSVAQCAIATQ